MGCKEGLLPDSYLGLPLAANFKQKKVWFELVDKFESSLAHWKKRYLTKAERLVLVKSTHATLPVYMFSIFMAPCSIIDDLERIIRNFL